MELEDRLSDNLTIAVPFERQFTTWRQIRYDVHFRYTAHRPFCEIEMLADGEVDPTAALS